MPVWLPARLWKSRSGQLIGLQQVNASGWRSIMPRACQNDARMAAVAGVVKVGVIRIFDDDTCSFVLFRVNFSLGAMLRGTPDSQGI